MKKKLMLVLICTSMFILCCMGIIVTVLGPDLGAYLRVFQFGVNFEDKVNNDKYRVDLVFIDSSNKKVNLLLIDQARDKSYRIKSELFLYEQTKITYSLQKIDDIEYLIIKIKQPYFGTYDFTSNPFKYIVIKINSEPSVVSTFESCFNMMKVGDSLQFFKAPSSLNEIRCSNTYENKGGTLETIELRNLPEQLLQEL